MQMETLDAATVLAPAYGFTWLPLAKEQHQIARDLYARYCRRYGLPTGGNPGGEYWLGIVDVESGKIAGTLGINFDAPTESLEVAALYVFPTRRGIRAMHATVRRLAELYDAGHLKFVCCHVLVENRMMQREVAKYFDPRGGGIRANLYAVGSVESWGER